MLYGCLRNIDRFMARTHGKNRDSLLLSILLQLFNRRRTVHVTGRQKRISALCLQLARYLGRGRRLTGAL